MKRLAITIAGAVSLGSYEAGVLYEIIHALGQHNADPRTPEEERIVIDVLTGASAGGMTATIAAQKLLFDAASLEGPYANTFYRPWVEDVDLVALLQNRPGDNPLMSLLSSQLIQDISHRYLTDRYQGAPPVPRAHPAAAKVLHLGLALSNLNGIDYGLGLRPSGQFVYTRYQDQLTTSIESANPATGDTMANWEPIRNAAVSCGAFPFAFRVVEVTRPGQPPQPFAYTDGGTFNNEPLGLAKNLVDGIDGHLDTENRFYLFVAPRALSSTANRAFQADQATYLPLAKQLVGAILDQAGFQDWVIAEQMNEQIDRFNERASDLADYLADAEAGPVQALASSIDLLLKALFPVAQQARLDGARARLKSQFRADYQRLPASVRDTWIDAVLTFETAADLGTRDEMSIYGITAGTTELASTELFSFAGFFDRRFRDHDYDIGRTRAQAMLATLNTPGADGEPDPLGPVRFTPEPVRPIDPALDGLTFDQMDPKVRQSVRQLLLARANVILDAAGVDGKILGGMEREAIELVVLKPVLDKLLRL